MLTHIARIPVEESLTPFIRSAGATLVGIRATFGWSQNATRGKEAWWQS
jgi:hypothetical protein